jgi:Transglutaminase-like superfamily
MNTKIPFRYLLIIWSLFTCSGCTPSPPDQVAATEKVLREVGDVTKSVKTTEIPKAPTTSEPLGPSVVKQAGENQSKESNAFGIGSTRSGSQQRQRISTDDPGRKWTTADNLPRDLWEVQYLGNAPVGFSHKRTFVSETLGVNYFQHELDSRIRVSVRNMPQEQRIRILTIERDNGELITIEGSLELGPNKQTFKGSVNQEVLRLSGDDNGKRFDVQLEWRKDYRGPFAVEQSMLRKPMSPGDLRKLKYFDPLRRKLVDGVLDAKAYIPTPTMLGGSQELLEVRSIGMIGVGGSQSLLWVDKNGDALKSFVPENDILSYRSTSIAGQIFETCTNLRALPAFEIPLRGNIEKFLGDGNEMASTTFRFRHKTADIYPMFTDKVGLSVKSVDPRTVDVTVYRNRTEADAFFSTTSAAKTPAYLANSDFVPKESSSIQKLGSGVMASDRSLSNDSSNTDKAKAVQREIQKRMARKEYDVQIRPLAYVAKSRKGNCVEHATMLAAVCRSLGIPTRIAIGVKYNDSEENPAMKFHAWVEIQDGPRWVAMDSSQESFPTFIDRVKFRDSDFNSENPYLELLEVYKLMPELEIEVK